MTHEQLVAHAAALLHNNPEYLDDAREGAPIGNSTIGSVMSLTLQAPRWATEPAVCDAVKRLKRGTRRKRSTA